jgi:hypothetical protein
MIAAGLLIATTAEVVVVVVARHAVRRLRSDAPRLRPGTSHVPRALPQEVRADPLQQRRRVVIARREEQVAVVVTARRRHREGTAAPLRPACTVPYLLRHPREGAMAAAVVRLLTVAGLQQVVDTAVVVAVVTARRRLPLLQAMATMALTHLRRLRVAGAVVTATHRRSSRATVAVATVELGLLRVGGCC